jgi:hypothetical protein
MNEQAQEKEPTHRARYVARSTIADVRAARPTYIYYAIHTCWWAYRSSDLYRIPDSSVTGSGPGLPCDPRRSVLMMTKEGDFETFLRGAEENPEHYGKHGLRAFEAALHGNVVVAATGHPTSFKTWGAYNDLLDKYDLERGAS